MSGSFQRGSSKSDTPQSGPCDNGSSGDAAAQAASRFQRGRVAISRSQAATACSSRLASRRLAARAWEAVMVFGSGARAKRWVGAPVGALPERDCCAASEAIDIADKPTCRVEGCPRLSGQRGAFVSDLTSNLSEVCRSSMSVREAGDRDQQILQEEEGPHPHVEAREL